MLAGMVHARLGGGHRTPSVRGGTAVVGSSATGPRQSLHGEHGGGSGVVSSKVAEGGAHPGRPSTTRWWEGASVVVLKDDGRALVAGDDQRRALGH
jgi:hypothetical protein